jgi:tetratricopeptide (TPR) repeat protein
VVCLADEGNKNEIPITCSSSNEALLSFQNGREAFEMGRLNDATELFDKAIRNDSQFALAYLYRAYTANSEIAWKRNMELAIQNKNLISEGEKILIDMESALSDKDGKQRLELAKRLVELYPSSARARLILAGEHQARKAYLHFRDEAMEAIKLAPDSPFGYRMLGSSFLLDEPLDIPLAQKYIAKFAELRPNEASAQIAMGDVYRVQFNWEDALQAYSKAIKLDPSNDIAYAKRGYVKAFHGAAGEARYDWERSLLLAGEKSKIYWPYNSIASYRFPLNGKFPVERVMQYTNGEEKKIRKHPLEDTDADHYFCCTVISAFHGVYVSPFKDLNESSAIERELLVESKAPDPVTIEANITFMEAFWTLSKENFELAKVKALAYARIVKPDVKPRKLQVYNYLMGLINLKEKNYGKAADFYLASDVSNAIVKYELGLAYDRLGEWEKAKEMFAEVARYNFTTVLKPPIVGRSQKLLNSSYAVIPTEE